jgi:tetratricopeptide (TPR) repeat protein
VILFGLLLAAQALPFTGTDAARFEACTALLAADPAKAVADAERWRGGGGGPPAQQCLGMAFAAQERWAPAVAAFEQGAKEAELKRDGRAATLWVLAGNAALGGNEAAAARNHFDRALALPVLEGAFRGEALVDRARAQVALADMAAARADLDAALKLVAADPMAWLLSATLARRQSDLPRAEQDIAQAARLAPDDASVALEAGNIAKLAGADDAARTAWEQAIKLEPEGAAGQSAKAALDRLAQAAPAAAGK